MSQARSAGFQRYTDGQDPIDPMDFVTKRYAQALVTAGSVPDGAVTQAKLAGSPTIAAGHNIGTDGTNFVDDGVPGDPHMRTGKLASTLPRSAVTSGTQAAATTGQLEMYLIKLRAGMQVSTIGFVSGTTALGTGVNQWFGLWSYSATAPTLLGVTNDDTSTAWGSNAEKPLTIQGGAINITTTGLYYVGKMIAATTVPTMTGVGGITSINGLAPITAGTATGTFTNPASAPTGAAAALTTVITRTLYAWVG